MVRVYVQSKRECPSDAVLRTGEKGALYYVPDERGSSSEVGGNVNTFESLLDGLSKQEDDPCWEGYTMVGMKEENGEMVPNCVPEEDAKAAFEDFREKAASRVYIGSPQDVPQQLDVMEDESGMYYEVDSITDDLGELTEEALEEFIEYFQSNQETYESAGQSDDNLRQDIEDSIAEVEQELMTRDYKFRIGKSKVYVDSPEEVPDQYQVQTSDNGVIYYETESSPEYENVWDDMSDDELEDVYDYALNEIGDEETADSVAQEMEDRGLESPIPDFEDMGKQAEIREGLTWQETVRIDEVDMDEGEVTMMDHLSGSTWVEDVEDVENKLELLPEQDHDWVYDLVAGHYAEMEPEDVHEVLHEAVGMEVDRQDVAAGESKAQRVYVGKESEVPAGHDVHKEDGNIFYYKREPEYRDKFIEEN